MHRITRRTFATGMAALSLSVVPTVSFGQDDYDEAESSELLAQVPGLQSAYARRYNPADDMAHIHIDMDVMDATDETPDHLVVMALEFGSAAELTGVLGMMLNTNTAGLILNDTHITLTEEPVGEFPRGSTLYYGSDPDHESYKSLLVIPVDNIAYAISTRGVTEAVQVTADAIGAHLVAQEPTDSPVVVVSEGLAEGGPFEVFPGEDDLELLNGLIPMFDYDLLVSEFPILPPDATPDASPAV